MKLLDYIRGTRKGKEAHRLQKEAMRDPFLADAMDGYDRVGGDQEQQIVMLRRRITARAARKQNRVVVWSVAASLLIGVCLSSFFLFQKNKLPEDAFMTLEAFQRDTVLNTVPQIPQLPVHQLQAEKKKMQVVNARKDSAQSLLSQESRAKKMLAPMLQEEMDAEVERSVTETELPVAMNQDQQMLDEVVVVGYGSTKKPDLTGAVVAVEQLTLPQPLIGKKAYRKYLRKNMIRPIDEACAQARGEVVLTFHVNESGRPFDIKVKTGLCPSADKEAVRLVEEGPDWTTGSKEVTLSVQF